MVEINDAKASKIFDFFLKNVEMEDLKKAGGLEL